MNLIKKLNYNDYVLIPNDGKRHELINGEHYMSPAPEINHQKISRNLEFVFHKYFMETNTGEIFYAPVDVCLSEFDLVQPDLVVLSKNNDIITPKFINGAPDLIVEILSPSNREYDLVLKKDLYEKHGVNEYWIIDCDLKIIQKYELKNGAYADAGIFKDKISSGKFPGLVINLKDVFC